MVLYTINSINVELDWILLLPIPIIIKMILVVEQILHFVEYDGKLKWYA